MYYRFALVTFALAVGASTAGAHPGPRIWINIDNQQVTTYAGNYPPGLPEDYWRSRIFTQPLVDEGDDIWDNDFPGYQMVPGGTIPVHTNFSYTIAGSLLWYNAGDATHAPKFQTVASHFGSGAPQFAVTNELLQTTYTGVANPATELAYTYNGGDGDHNHLTYTLLGDGTNPVGGPDGIYALPLVFSSPGITTSDEFFLLLGKNVTTDQLDGAAALGRQTLLLPGDSNGDGVVNFVDFQHLELGFGKTDAYPGDGDFNFDGVVDRADLEILIDHYGQYLTGQDPPVTTAMLADLSSQSVPEPGTLAICALFLCAGMLGRPSRARFTLTSLL